MGELFLNPWSMAAGAALVSSPVIIHLINRMRFKRVRWAAMEFLLKAQKRMRRKMILEQLLLLLLRIVAVLLVGLLVGRFLGFDPLLGRETRSTVHVAILDDTPSMGDAWRTEAGAPTDAFEQAKSVLVKGIGPAAAQATTPQLLEVVRVSDPGDRREFGRVNAQSLEQAEGYLAPLKPAYVRAPLAAALRAARDRLSDPSIKDSAKIVHVLSDFRGLDWAEGADAIKEQIDALTQSGAKVHLVDAAHPFRRPERRVPLAQDNAAIVEFRPLKAQSPLYEASEFLVRVQNFGVAELRDVRVAVSVNGDDNKGLSLTFPSVPSGQSRSLRFDLTFDRVGTPEAPLDRFSLVTARIAGGEPGGLAVDNVRHAVAEVRKRLPVLAVEGRPNLRDQKEGDGFYLRNAVGSALPGFAWTPGSPRDLEKPDLRNYAAVLMLNAPAPTEAGARNLEKYVREGGGVGFFLGPDVNPGEYNKLLHAGGAGVFPVPLPERPTEPLTPDQQLERRYSLARQLLPRDPSAKAHPILRDIYFDRQGNEDPDRRIDYLFLGVVVNRYFPVARLGKWRDDPNVSELFCMPNTQAMADYEAPVRKLADALPANDAEFARFKDVLASMQVRLRKLALSSEPLATLADALDRLLSDGRGDGAKDEALLREFWGNPKVAELKATASRLRETVKYGDPFLLAKRFGAGRSAAVVTTAGEQWTDWPNGTSRSFSPVVSGLMQYLASGTAEREYRVGDAYELTLDPARFKPAVGRAFLTWNPSLLADRPGVAAEPPKPTDLQPQTLAPGAESMPFRFDSAREPGAYLFALSEQTPAEGSEGEFRAFAANVDAAKEGDLRRASADDVAQTARGAELHAADETEWLDALKNRRSDLSEGVWLFLLLGAVLMAEQALSVRLSHHAAAGELSGSAPSAAAVMARHWGHHAGETAVAP